jgi:hypothetical protein
MSFPATVDPSRQQITLAAFPGLDVAAWLQDLMAKIFSVQGLFDIVVSDTAPLDTRKIWYKVANPPSGSPGTYWVYDSTAEDWVALTPSLLTSYLSIVPRAKDFVQSTVPTTDQAAVPGDWWFDTSTGRMSRYVTVAANTNVWIDVTGATLDGNTILALQAKQIKTVSTLPSAASVPGVSYLVTDGTTGLIGSVVTGGSTNKYVVTSDGTSWRIG